MRLYIELSPNQKPVPFTYQAKLVGSFHKWLGKNSIHDAISMYSLSWLTGSKKYKGMLEFPEGARWFISSPDRALIKNLVDGIFSDPELAYGMKVQSLTLRETPDFGKEHRFLVNSPVLVKRKLEGDENETHFIWNQPESDHYLTETLQHKLENAGISGKLIEAGFDRNYAGAKTKMVQYKDINNRASLCPVFLKGDPEAISFAWDVGVGNSTGIGFGALV